MPDPAIAAAAINAAGQAGQGILGLGSAALNRRWAKKDYERQRSDNLADWHMQNAYNSPQAQMQRLKDAGLNPHLVYGTGAVANSANLPKNADITTVQMEPPQFDAGSVLGSYFDAQVKQAQVDNMEAQRTVMEQEALLKAAQILATGAGTKKTEEETTNIQMLRSTTLEAARKNIEQMSASIDKTKADTQYTMMQNIRAQELQPVTIAKMEEEIKSMVNARSLTQYQRNEILQRISNLIKEGKLKDWEIKLSEMGIRPGDPLYQRKISEWFNEATKPIKAALRGEGTIKKRQQPKSFTNWLDRYSPY